MADIAFRAESQTAEGGASVEIGTVTVHGRDFSACGSVVDHARGRIVAYVAQDGRTLTTWDGRALGAARVVSTYPAVFFGRRSWIGSRVYCYRATVDGRAYYGRGFGPCMLLRLRACKGGA